MPVAGQQLGVDPGTSADIENIRGLVRRMAEDQLLGRRQLERVSGGLADWLALR
jgi:hypothetical protein